MSTELDDNGHIKECAGYGGFDCDCTERAEGAIIAWTRAYIDRYSVPREELDKIENLFKLLYNREWS